MMIPDVSGLARLLADPGRARMLTYLMHHDTATASELANSAGLSPQAASNHLAQLVRGQLLPVSRMAAFITTVFMMPRRRM